MLQKTDIIAAVPTNLRSTITDGLVSKINAAVSDPDEAEAIRDNFMSYAVVLREGKFKVEDYLNAVAYVSYKLMGYTNEEAYSRTFPARYTQLKSLGKTSKQISSYVAHYNKGKLVNLIFEQSHIPMWVLHQDTYNEAIKTQFDLMTDTNISPKVRSDAANSLLTHLKKPESKEINLNLGVEESSGLKELKQLMTGLAERQLSAIDSGTPTREIAHQVLQPEDANIIDAEYSEVGDTHDK